MRAYAIVLGGGSGRRMGAGSNKVFLPLRGVPVIVRALAPFTGLCAGAVAVAAPGEEDLMRQTLRRYGMERFVLKVVCGGAERQQSVAAGLDALPADAEAVLVHDGARPLLRQQTVRRVLESVALHGTGIAAVPLVDTVKRAQADGCVLETPDRESLYAVQTPQGFRVAWLRQAHEQARREGYLATDDAALLERAGLDVYLCEGERENLKITQPLDLTLAELLLAGRAEKEMGL
ncbi:MAG TPA: 2-C-methyl-D-erythritol 4-phosphate cytidylyltransferase [Candidatus Limiplasma stercoravium]|nr:2-C-methyl-D-erythritol 4-phosphate cytidylyltransferase [Candidatus Limiplasma stercoravium]